MNLIHNYDTFLFDLDGTLTDPGEGIVNSLLYSLSRMGIQETDHDKLLTFIGPPLVDSFVHWYGFDDDQVVTAIAHYREFFRDKGLYQNIKYDGIETMLDKLHKHGKKMFIATTKPTVFAEKVADRFDFSRYFLEIVGSELDGRRTKKDEVIKTVFNRHDLQKHRSIMIGDRLYDIVGAKKNGIDSIGVGYGFGSRKELEDAGADFYVDTIEELQTLILGNQIS